MSVIELKGDVIAKLESGVVQDIYLFIGIPSAGGSLDMSSVNNTVIISYIDDDHLIPTVNWTMQKLGTVNDDDILDPAELFMITVDIGVGKYNAGVL